MVSPRRSAIKVNTDQAVKVELVFVPGERPYIHFSADHLTGFNRLSGFIDDKDIAKLARWVAALPAGGSGG